MRNQVIEGDFNIKIRGKNNLVADSVINGILNCEMEEPIEMVHWDNNEIGEGGIIVNAPVKILKVTRTTTPFIQCNYPDCELHIDVFSHNNTKITGFKSIRMI